MASGSYMNNGAPLPPPPVGFRGGNRTNQHVVAGPNANVAYSAGANLAAARQGVANGSSFFRNQAQQRPAFNGVSPANAPVGINDPNAIGAQMRANTAGMVRNPNSDPGLGYGNLSNPIRQHMLYDPNGQEFGSYQLDVVKANPQQQVTPTSQTSSTTTTANPATTNPNYAGPTGPTSGTVAAGTAAPKFPNGFTADMFNGTYLNVWSNTEGRYLAKDINKMSQQEVFTALLNGQNNNALGTGYYLADNNTIKKGTPPADWKPPSLNVATSTGIVSKPAPTSPIAPPPPPPPTGTTSTTTIQRKTYDPAIHVGRIALSNGQWAPLVRTPNGGTAIDPTWQKWMLANNVVKK